MFNALFRAFVVGIVVGVLLLVAAVYFYVSSGRAPVAVAASPILFEQTLTHKALHAYLDKLPHLNPQVPADETNYLAGAKVYRQQCAVCHGLPDQPKTTIAEGMYPSPPQLFHGMGVTDDEAWESYWKVENGIRLTGMPSFKSNLTETQIWQATVLVKNADKIPASVKNVLLGAPAATEVPPLPLTPAAPLK